MVIISLLFFFSQIPRSESTGNLFHFFIRQLEFFHSAFPPFLYYTIQLPIIHTRIPAYRIVRLQFTHSRSMIDSYRQRTHIPAAGRFTGYRRVKDYPRNEKKPGCSCSRLPHDTAGLFITLEITTPVRVCYKGFRNEACLSQHIHADFR